MGIRVRASFSSPVVTGEGDREAVEGVTLAPAPSASLTLGTSPATAGRKGCYALNRKCITSPSWTT